MRERFKVWAAIALAAPLAVATPVIAAPSDRAVAAATELHSNPHADDNLRLYVMLEAPSATLSLDSGAPAALEAPSSVMFTRLQGGPHRAVVNLTGNVRASLDFTLANEEQIESKGRRWWCLATGHRAGQLMLVQLDPARCKSMADAGPD